MAYGNLAAKWWGPRNVRPILAIHGWQDNAGTFDTLIPALPPHHSYLAIDMPGHGLSSRLPNGLLYTANEDMYTLNAVIRYFGWEKVSLMGHSNGSITCVVFTAAFPDRVDMVIALDSIIARVLEPKLRRYLLRGLDDVLVADLRNQDDASEPPAYTVKQLIDRLNSQTFLSVTRETALCLLQRGVRASRSDPDKYYFTRDNRLKMYNFAMFPQELCLEMAELIKCPFLFVKALHSPHFEPIQYYEETVAVMQRNPQFEMHYADGGHHVHLTDPHLIAGPISAFLDRVRSKGKL